MSENKDNFFEKARGLLNSRDEKSKAQEIKRQTEEKKRQQNLDETRARLEAAKEKLAASKKPKILAKHVVKSDETLSHIALKYYGSAVKDKWMIIYEANKDVIGDNPNIIRPGMELVIPEIDD